MTSMDISTNHTTLIILMKKFSWSFYDSKLAVFLSVHVFWFNFLHSRYFTIKRANPIWHLQAILTIPDGNECEKKRPFLLFIPPNIFQLNLLCFAFILSHKIRSQLIFLLLKKIFLYEKRKEKNIFLNYRHFSYTLMIDFYIHTISIT